MLEPLRAYIRGHATGDPTHFRHAFLSTAHIDGIRDGAFVSWHLDEYCTLFQGRPAPDEPTRTRRIDGPRRPCRAPGSTGNDLQGLFSSHVNRTREHPWS